MLWGTTPQKGCVLALPPPGGRSRALCAAPGAQPKPSRLQPGALCSPRQRTLGPLGNGLTCAQPLLPASRPTTTPTAARRSPRCTCPQEPGDLLSQGSAFREAVTEFLWVLFWEHKVRKVPLGEFSLLSCVLARIYSRGETGALSGLSGRTWSCARCVRRRPLSAPPPPPLEGPALSLRAKIPSFRASLVSLGFSRCP